MLSLEPSTAFFRVLIPSVVEGVFENDVYDVFRMYFLVRKTNILIHFITPYERIKADEKFRILVLGDSTAYGTGAKYSTDTTAGRLASQYPDAEVVNHSVNGLKIIGLESILKDIDENERFDIVLIQIGANDIIRLTPMEDIEIGIGKILERSKKFGGKVIVLHSGDIGEAEFFPWYLQLILSKRSHDVREIYRKVSQLHGSYYVDLIDSPISGKMRNDPQKYYSNDLLHLSGEGYGLWFSEIVKKL
jgi:lysophospholipase L1-like esterase